MQRIFYMYICCVCYWFYLRRNDVQIIKQVSRMDRKEAIEYAKFRLECHTKGDGEYTDYGEFLVAAIEALQEPERIIKQLEELRDEPLMYCSEDYWEGHYIAAKEAIAIVKGEEE